MSMQGRVARTGKDAYAKSQAMKPKEVVRYSGHGFGAVPVKEKQTLGTSKYDLYFFDEVSSIGLNNAGMEELIHRAGLDNAYMYVHDLIGFKPLSTVMPA